jgi:uncharacterized protein (DUF2147 family)
MRTTFLWLLLLLVIMAACGHSSQSMSRATSVPPVGRWLTASGNFDVEIAACDSALCGTIVRVISNRSMPDPRLEMLPTTVNSMIGRKILTDFRPSGHGEWLGHIYNRENGKTYDCVMALVSPEHLMIRPYKIIRLFGQTQMWQRVNDATRAN